MDGIERDLYADFCATQDAPMLWLAEPDWRIIAGNPVARRLLEGGAEPWPAPAALAAGVGEAPRPDVPITRGNVVWAIAEVRSAAGDTGGGLLARLSPHFGARRFAVDGTRGVVLYGRPEAIRAHSYINRAASEEEYRLLFEHAIEGLATLALDGTFLRVNPRLAAMLGVPAEAIVGRNVASFHHPTSPGTFYEFVSEITRAGHARFERVFARADGSPVHVLISSAVLRDPTGQPSRYVAMYHDVSELRAAEATSRHSQQLAVIGRFAGGIAHDINNLLAGILGYAELIGSEIDDPSLTGFCERLIDTTRRAGDFASGLLSFARVGETRWEAFDVAGIVAEVVDFLQHVTPPRVAVRSDVSSGPATLHGDPSHMHAALVNLGLNAAEAIERDGSVTFALERSADGSQLRIVVSDTGHGMTPDQVEQIFEPFFTTKRATHGTGLGLTSVRAVAERFGGEIEVASTPGEGSTFTLVLPVPEAGVAHPAADSTGPVAASTHVLVVDDDDTVRFVVASALRRYGCEVVEAADGAAAMAMLETADPTPDVMVFDLRMPTVDGRDLFSRARTRWPDMAYVLMTGFSAGDEADELYGAGVDAVLQKPFSAQMLADTVAAALGRRAR